MRKSKLEIGQKYNHITLIEKLEKTNKHGANLWLCKCICGTEKIVPSGKVRAGHSCGCIAKKHYESRNVLGKKFGKLLVLNRLEETDKHRCKKYLCKCDCGKEKIISSHYLVSGGIKSCGCLLMGVKLPFGESAFNNLFSSYKISAKKRNLNFVLSKDKFKDFTKMNCFYCNESPKQIIKTKTGHGHYVYNGIDRIDSLLGYSDDNGVACCGRCNRM